MNFIACCGLDCAQCPAHLVWQNNDHDLRQKTAREWSQMFKSDITPDQINCAGCHSPKSPCLVIALSATSALAPENGA